MKSLGWVVPLLTAAVGCGPTSRGAVSFDGRGRPRLVAPDQIEEVQEVPAGYRVLGHASASCTLTSGARELRGAWLSDVDCSDSRLRAAVRERAAAAGGELLVGLVCKSEPRAWRHQAERTAISCRAGVARSTDAARDRRAPRPTSTPPAGVESPPAALQAWQIRVDYTRVPNAEARAPRRSEAVQELAVLPPSHRRLGDIVTRCSADCSEQGAYEGLLAVAGRMGASDVAEVGCVQRGEGWICTALAAGTRVDPDQDPAAR